MIVVKLQGGLGNQMFQYATARKLAYFHNTKLKLDIRQFTEQKPLSLKGGTPRNYEIGIFNIIQEFATQHDFSEIIKYKIYPSYFIENRYYKKLIRLIKKHTAFYRIPEYSIIDEIELGEINIKRLPDNIYMIGYWARPDYFADIEKLLRQEFTFKNIFPNFIIGIKEQISSINSVSINVRRGDYVSNIYANKYFGTLSEEYFYEAINYIKRKVNEPIFYVFSDDIEWCKNNLKINGKHYYM